MINVNMTDKAGVTLATAGKYCADNVKVTPSADILRKDEQAKTATPTTSAQDITPDAGKALSKVTVNPITAAIVGNLDASSFAASIVSAIEGKGVTVPDGTLLDGMAALIESIQAGGGGGAKIACGKFTLSEDVRSYTVQHNLGVTPNFAVLSYDFSYATSQNCGYACFAYSNKQNGVYRSTSNLLAGNVTYALTNTTALPNYNLGRLYAMCNRANDTEITFGYFDDNNHNLMLKGGGGPYLWIVGVVE